MTPAGLEPTPHGLRGRALFLLTLAGPSSKMLALWHLGFPAIAGSACSLSKFYYELRACLLDSVPHSVPPVMYSV